MSEFISIDTGTSLLLTYFTLIYTYEMSYYIVMDATNDEQSNHVLCHYIKNFKVGMNTYLSVPGKIGYLTIKRYYATNSQRITGNLSTSVNEDPNIFINLCISNVGLLNILVSRNETPSLCEPFSSLTYCKASLVQVTTKYKDYL